VKSVLIFIDAVGTIHKEFVPPGQTVNAKFYCDVLQRLMEDMRQKRPHKWHTNNWVLHHDNAPAHTVWLCSRFGLQNHDGRPPPLYSPDLALWDFLLFPRDDQVEGAKI
jgi:hypothetical protein